MDKYLSTPSAAMSKKSTKKKPSTQEVSITPAMLRSKPKNNTAGSQDTSPLQLPISRGVSSSAPLLDEEPPSPHWSTPSSPGTNAQSDQAQAISVAQAVSDILMPLLDKRLDLLHVSINSALSQITSITQRIGEMETRIAATEADLSTSHRAVENHESQIRLLQEKIDDLENRSRRCNLRFIGIPETIKGEDLSAFITNDLTAALGLSFPQDPPLIERAHRLGGTVFKDGGRPRPTIAKFFHYSTKEKILQSYRNQRTLLVRSHKILVFQDFSAAVTAKRKLFTPTCKYLVDHGIKFQLQYPAKLRVMDNGQTITYMDSTAAEARYLRGAPDQDGNP